MTCPRCGHPAVCIARTDHDGRVMDRSQWGHKCWPGGDWHFFRASEGEAPAAVQGRLPGFEVEAEAAG